MKNIAIIGAGGFAREVAWLIEDCNKFKPTYNVVTHLVSDLNKVNDPYANNLVVNDFAWLEANYQKVDSLVLGIGSPTTKAHIVAEIQERFPDLQWPNLIHPSVRFDPTSTRFGKGVILCAGSIATVNTVFGDFAMVNLMCTIGHESTIARYCVLNPTVNVSGGVHIGEEVLIGAGAQILQNLSIGDRATIGAGSVVTKDVPSGQTVVGIPAKPLGIK